MKAIKIVLGILFCGMAIALTAATFQHHGQRKDRPASSTLTLEKTLEKTRVTEEKTEKVSVYFFNLKPGETADKDVDGNHVYYRKGQRVKFYQPGPVIGRFEVVNKDIPNLKIDRKIYTSGKTTSRDKLAIKNTSEKELKIKVILF